MITNLINQQEKHLIHLANLQVLTDWLGEKLTPRTAPTGWSEVSVVLVDDEGMTLVNNEYFGKNRPTDVISFRYDPIPGEEQAFSGDLIVNVDRALQEGTERDAVDYELALYIAHGFDHLSGAEDDTYEKHLAMRATETEWLSEAETLDMLHFFPED